MIIERSRSLRLQNRKVSRKFFGFFNTEVWKFFVQIQKQSQNPGGNPPDPFFLSIILFTMRRSTGGKSPSRPPQCDHLVPPLFFRLKLLRGSGGDHPPRRRFGGGASKVFLLTLILILLPPKGGLGAQPQGFDFDSFFCLTGIMSLLSRC